MVMVYAGGHISGAHYNPAVTLAVWLRGKLPKADVLPYITAQVAGAVVSALIVTKFRGQGSEAILSDPLRVAGAEFLGTFALAWVLPMFLLRFVLSLCVRVPVILTSVLLLFLWIGCVLVLLS